MDSAARNSFPAFGFLTVVEDPQHGFFGGFLVLSELGRPLEFHCSTPILPTPAQKILYGSTLRSYVLGELIGPTLVEKAQVPVQVVLTDLQPMLSLGLVWDGTLAWVLETQECENVLNDSLPANLDPAESAAGDDASTSPVLVLEEYQLLGSTTCRWVPDELRATLAPLLMYVDLAEPFVRIREAIAEAQRVTEHPAGDADEAAAA